MGRWCAVLLLTTACSTFATADTDGGDEGGETGAASTSGGAGTSPSASTTSAGSQGGTSGPSATTEPSDSNPGTSEETSEVTSESGSSSSTSTTGGMDGSSSSSGVAITSCEDLVIEDTIPMECSIESVTDAELSIYNNCESVSIEVFWVGYDCGEVSYGIRGPTETFQIPSYDTHPWRIRNAETGELMREIPPLMGDTSLDVLMR